MKLNHVSDEELLKKTLYWAQQERQATSQLLWHLKELDERRLYSTLKCSSLFDYCVRILKHAEGQASRRVSACRLLKQIPEIITDIEKGHLNLTQLNQARQFFKEQGIKTSKEKKQVLDKIKDKTTRETERILWELKKVEGPRKVRVLLNEETVEELKRVQGLKGHTCPDMDSLLMKMSQTVIRIWDPTHIQRKRRMSEGDTRYVQVQVKAYVWERDQGKCTNCGSTHRLELDHILPFAAGGKTTAENLRLLCWSCNQRKALEHFGPMRSDPHFAFK